MRNNSAILVVDDSVEICETLEFLLSSEGYRVQGAQDGKTALSLIASTVFSLVLLDLNLPDIRGEDLIQKIKQNPQTSDAHVVLFSAGSNIKKLAEDHHIKSVSKPFKFDDILSLVRALPDPPRKVENLNLA